MYGSRGPARARSRAYELSAGCACARTDAALFAGSGQLQAYPCPGLPAGRRRGLARPRPDFANWGASFAKRCTSFARRGASFARRGASFARRGASFAKRGASFAKRGASAARLAWGKEVPPEEGLDSDC